MGRPKKKKVPPEFEGLALVASFTGFCCDHPETGQPIAVSAGETFRPDDPIVKEYGSYYFADAGLPSWELAQLRMKRERGHV